MKCNELTVHAIRYARSSLPESMVLTGGDPDQRCPIVFLLYLIDTGRNKILIDAGCDTLPGFEMEDFQSPAAALSDYGVQPEEITDVIITHAHHDHIDGIRHFPNATIHIQEDEYRKGKSYIPKGSTVHTFAQQCTVAGCIHVQRIGGHSEGSSIAVIHTAQESLVFGGDECYLPVCFQKHIPTGASCDPAKSMQFLEKYANSRYQILLAHDPGIPTGKRFTIRKEMIQ